MLTLRGANFSPMFCLTALTVVDIPNLCAIDVEESFSMYALLDPRPSRATLLLQNHSKITITAAAAIPPIVPPTMVPVDGRELELTGSAIGCPVA